jgi:integral membrane sensor domain MASE1
MRILRKKYELAVIQSFLAGVLSGAVIITMINLGFEYMFPLPIGLIILWKCIRFPDING